MNGIGRAPWQPCTATDWRSVQVKRAFSVTLGKMLQNSSSASSEIEVSYLKAQHVQWDRVKLSDLPTMWASEAEVDVLLVKPGDLLVCEGGEVGRAAIVADTPQDRTIIQNALHLVRGRNGAEPRFLAYLLKHASDQGWFDVICNRSTIAHFTMEKFEEQWVCLPDEGRQRAIADYLDRETARLDALVAAKGRLLDLLAEKRQALITRAVTRGLDPDVPLRDSGIPWLGKVPRHWDVTRLKFVGRVQTGLALGKQYQAHMVFEYPYLRVANVQEGFLDLSNVKAVFIPEQEARSYLLRAGDVLMNEGGDADKLGRGAVWTGEIDPCLHQNHVFAVRARAIFSDWLALWISSDHAKAYFESRSKQSTNLASISATNLMEMPLLRPPESEQSAIARAVHNVTREIDAAHSTTECTIELLKERRAALIAAAVTGQIDVKEEA